jgi:hypothetical protein
VQQLQDDRGAERGAVEITLTDVEMIEQNQGIGDKTGMSDVMQPSAIGAADGKIVGDATEIARQQSRAASMMKTLPRSDRPGTNSNGGPLPQTA